MSLRIRKLSLRLGLAAGLAVPLLAAAAAPESNSAFNVRSFGAVGDGTSKDTAAVQKALDTCVAAGGGEVRVPAGHYLIGSITLGSNTTLHLEKDALLTGSPDVADYPLIDVRWEGEWRQGHRALIFATHADRVAIVGPGGIVGPVRLGQLRNPRGPVIAEFVSCSNVLLDGFSTTYQRLWSIHPVYCQNLIARNLHIRSTQTNGDGIDVDSCQNLLIDHCDIDTGDDAIALKSGRGMGAVRIGQPTENVIIKDCTLGSNFAGVGIGTEISGGVRNIRIENCAFVRGGQNAIFIKSRAGRGSFIENVTGENLTVGSGCLTFLSIDLVTKGIQGAEPVPGDLEKWTRARNISFKNIKVDGVGTLIIGRNLSPARPLDGLTLENITGTCKQGITLANVINADFHDLNVTGFTGELLTTTNVVNRVP